MTNKQFSRSFYQVIVLSNFIDLRKFRRFSMHNMIKYAVSQTGYQIVVEVINEKCTFNRKTNAELQSDWRKKNLEKSKQQNREKNRTYRQKIKDTLSNEEKLEARKKHAERQRILRGKKKQDSSKTTPFNTPQVKGKLMKKVRESLTGTRDQTQSILSSLMSEFIDDEPCQVNVITGYSLPSETLEKVKDFFFNNQISRPSPNVSDFVTVVENQEKKRLSVNHLLFSLKECHGMFCEENPTLKISLAKFCKMRPPNVLSFTKIPHNVCVCQSHENIRCALKGLKSSHPAFSTLPVDYKIHENFVCESAEEKCFKNKCEDCSDCRKLKDKVEQIESVSQNVSWSKWVKTKDDNGTPYCNI